MSGSLDEIGPAISVSASVLYRQAQAAVDLAKAMRDRAAPGPGRNIPAALVARDRLRALIGDIAPELAESGGLGRAE